MAPTWRANDAAAEILAQETCKRVENVPTVLDASSSGSQSAREQVQNIVAQALVVLCGACA